MVPSLLNGVYLDGNSQILWDDGERVFCRGWRLGDDGNPSAVLVVLPATERPSPSSLDRLAHEYGLKDELDGLEIFRTVLGPLLEHAVVGRRTDQRNDDPDRILAQHDYRKRVARARPRAARFLQLDAVRRVTQRRHRNGRAAPIQSPQARHARWTTASAICQALVGRTLLRLDTMAASHSCPLGVLSEELPGFVQLVCLLVLFKRF
jgi:hypothetical protein